MYSQKGAGGLRRLAMRGFRGVCTKSVDVEFSEVETYIPLKIKKGGEDLVKGTI